MERDIILVAVGGLIGALSSLATLFVVYILEGMRLRRQWAREDRLRLREKREELQATLITSGQPESVAPGSEND
jgi:hypothetical protein